ncbi:MAG: beta-galactosidase [Lachnospiraceae bacterium]|nr:beta-galactosidase [Butyrivibrio sp.]MCM1344530.1 beta-galactosidase [Muribaculaceae bacterium]MCM1409358.1 beta-galactosidase [Lachnospiraceae bacterium]
MRKLINGNSIDLGVCYYPEHWPKSLWAEDLERMLAAGLTTVRIAEFAWNLIEPEESRFTYEFFDGFLELARKKAMQVIFCTPTATPPAWLTDRYPEVLNADREGNLICHGSRRHYNYNSPVYQEFCRRIVEKSASHYGQHPAIVGWQLDNEFNCENDEFYSESDTDAFRVFLQEKYGTLEALNEAWGTVFWNQTYTDWTQVYVPRKTNTGAVNPHLQLDYYRFISDSVCRFAGQQAEIIRKYCKADDFITTNGIFGNIDYQRMGRESLDVLMYDSYPNFAYCLDDYREEDLMKDRKWSRNLAEVRAVSPNFGIMEQQSGANGWNTRMEAPMPRPGQLTLWTFQSIAHGADFVSYFRWRTCNFGTEMYWHGILDHSGRENRRLQEVTGVSHKINAIQEVAGVVYSAKVGILKDYDNVWDCQVDRWHERVDRVSRKSLFTALQRAHVPFDHVYFERGLKLEDLKRYDVLFYPHASILTEERMALLEQYVAEGGKLVMGCRTGYKEINGKCVTNALPGLAARLTGTDIPEYSFVAPDDGKVTAEWDGEKMEAAVFNDLLAPAGENAEVLAVYADSYYAGTPALIRNHFGKGEAYYFGGAFALDTEELFIKKLGIGEPYGEILEIPAGCELAVRERDGAQYLFVLNYEKDSAEVLLKTELQELLSGENCCGTQTLEPYGVRVYKRAF